MRPALREARVWLPPVAMMAIIFALSSVPAAAEHHGVLYILSRKVGHFCEYALLVALWWRALATKMSDRRALALAVVIVLAYSISDEFHQTFVTGRRGRPLDVGIDMLGVSAASAVIVLKRPRRRAVA